MKSLSIIALALICALSFFDASNSSILPSDLIQDTELSERVDDTTEEDSESDHAHFSLAPAVSIDAQVKLSLKTTCLAFSILHCPYSSQGPPNA